MRVRTLAISYMAALGLLAIGSAAYVWSHKWTELSDIHEAGELVGVLQPGFKFVEAFALERGVYNQVLVSKATGAEAGRRLVAERNAATDALFAQALGNAARLPPSLRAAIEDPIEKAQRIIVDARSQAAPLLDAEAPPSPEAAGEIVQHFVEAGAQIDQALVEAERNLSKRDHTLGKMLEISRLSNDLREQAGSALDLAFAFRRDLKAVLDPRTGPDRGGDRGHAHHLAAPATHRRTGRRRPD